MCRSSTLSRGLRYTNRVPDTLKTFLRTQVASDREVLRTLRLAAADISKELKKFQKASSISGQVHREQLLRSQVAINERLSEFWIAVGDRIEAGQAQAAAAGARTVLEASSGALRAALSASDYRYLVLSAEASAHRSVSVAMQRVSGSSYIPLSSSVWRNQSRSTSTVNRIINSALAEGTSARELAKRVRQYVDPNTAGGVRYAALRLARTEINNAFHAAQVKEAQEEPWVIGVEWNLSRSHPERDECNDYAEQVHYPGGDPGVFLPEEVPVKPHPNCLCFTTPATPDREEFLDNLLAGRYDDYLEKEGIGRRVSRNDRPS